MLFQERVIGFGNARELAGGFVKRLLVGPLYANNEKIAAAILFALLIKYYVRKLMNLTVFESFK